MSVTTLIKQARASFWNSRESVIASHKTWDKEKDVRITVFSKCIHMTGSTWLGLVYIHRHLIHGEWWNEMHDAEGELLPASDAQIYVNEFDNFVKIGFIQLLISAIESSFRPVVRALDPSACANGTAEFKSIYAFLFARLKLQKWETLLDLLRNARNSIHNNGVFFPRSGNNEVITYNGIAYSFVVGTHVDFLYWEFLIGILSDVKEMLLEVINSPEINMIPAIVDPSVLP